MAKFSPHGAVALLSGGLDSMLAILTVLKQGIRVTAIRFSTPFDSHALHDVSLDRSFQQFSQQGLFHSSELDLGTEMLDIIKDPKHGYGKNMNPCIDCRIIMLKKARQFMDMVGADFLVTGEVLGQRPMSQRKDMLYHIDKEAGVTDMVLRPLCAKLLRETICEQRGIVDREMLFSFSGRSRKPQIALAAESGLDDYPAPAGGCLLTEPNYAFRLSELLEHDPRPVIKDIDLLRIGRHFRYSPQCKIVVGRDRSENEKIESLAQDNDCLLRVEGCGSPMTLISGKVSRESLRFAATICARYSDGRNLHEVAVKVSQGEGSFILTVNPADDEILDATRIGKGHIQIRSTA